MSQSVGLLGLDFADLTVEQAAARIATRSPGARFAYVVTPNADHLVRLAGDPALRTVYRRAWLCVLDSRVVGRLGRLFGLPVPSVATGSDLTAEILEHHLWPGERITIVGMDPAWVAVLCRRYGLAAPAHYNPPMGFDRDPRTMEAAVDFVTANPARFVFLAVGSPRQERLAAAVLASGGAAGTGLCIGSGLEFLAGAKRRAPVALQRAGLEWLFRLLLEPRRLVRRYLVDSPRVITLLLRQRFVAGREVPAPHT